MPSVTVESTPASLEMRLSTALYPPRVGTADETRTRSDFVADLQRKLPTLAALLHSLVPLRLSLSDVGSELLAAVLVLGAWTERCTTSICPANMPNSSLSRYIASVNK
ncbi:hypothetical protein MKX08_010240 [Trichoderma sp. CBMAI-0020]|nr:hypothetical protein MKX08_010240 [Trichoderma sp. CBMAI-0020]